MDLSYTQGREFRYLQRYWPNRALRGLLSCGHDDAVKLALVCLSLAGTMTDNRAVARLLDDDDTRTATLAENTLWSIWFRAGDDQANLRLVRAVHLIDRGRLDQAIELLSRIIHCCPAFAEAYNQRAIACFLKSDYACSIENCKKALQLNAHHFGALACLGHAYTSLGHLYPALEAYRRSLEVHPRLEGIRQSIHQIRQCIARLQPANHSPSTTA